MIFWVSVSLCLLLLWKIHQFYLSYIAFEGALFSQGFLKVEVSLYGGDTITGYITKAQLRGWAHGDRSQGIWRVRQFRSIIEVKIQDVIYIRYRKGDDEWVKRQTLKTL